MIDSVKTFLIVDDDDDDCEFFCEAIHDIDPRMKCMITSNGEDALILLKKDTKALPDYIFLDLNMHRMNGKQCLKILKSDDVLKSIPVIIFTTSSSPVDQSETMQLGASYFLTKPSNPTKLRSEIAYVLSKIW